MLIVERGGDGICMQEGSLQVVQREYLSDTFTSRLKTCRFISVSSIISRLCVTDNIITHKTVKKEKSGVTIMYKVVIS